MSTPSANRRAHMDSAVSDKAVATPSKTPARRALGELTPNATVSPQKPNITSERTAPPMSLSPLKQSHTVSSVQDENVYSTVKSPNQMTGRKRSIHEVDGAVAREDATETPAKRVDGRAALGKQPRPSVPDDDTLAAQIVDLANEDLSSTDEDSPEPAPPATQETTGTRASFSSLIDYNPAGSSQHTSSPPPLPAKASVKTQAEILRLRLRVALYKVKTDQTCVPLSRLEIPDKYQRKPASVPLPTSLQADAPGASPESAAQPVPTITVSSTRPVAANDGAASKLLPAPILRPTAYSTRFITEPYLPSSPSNPAGVEGNDTPRAQREEDFVTPVGSRRAATQLSSPPGSEEQGRARTRTENAVDSDSLTSSVVKGRAASGLLELMRSA